MKHIFVINPHSGTNSDKKELLEQLNKYTGKIDFQTYFTRCPSDATRYVNEYCRTHTNEEIVFYACGGDGTINEVANGLIGYDNAILSCYPCGSGNDFVKLYGGKEKFLNIDNLINGKETKIDIMKVNDRYAINVSDFGFDAEVCFIANKIKRRPIIGGKRAYTSGIIASIIGRRKTKCKIVVDEDEISYKKILLATIANGKYVGGAYMCAPNSSNSDGLLEVTIVKPVSIFKFLSLIKPYKEGKHLQMKEFQNCLTYKRAKKILISSDKEMKICLDGEIYKDIKFNIENLKEKIRFIKPRE